MSFVGCRVKGCPTNGTGPDGLCVRHRQEAGEGEARSRWPMFVDNELIVDEHGTITTRGTLALRYVRDTFPSPQPDMSEALDPLALQKLDEERERKRMEEE
jgi:hypothetical protein